jgi:Kdo2-lipid IVA lauroyltransferase/acyltransferase
MGWVTGDRKGAEAEELQPRTWTRLRRALRGGFETLLVVAVRAIVPALPRPWIRPAGAGLGWLVYHLARRERRIALANTDVAFGSGMTPDGKARLVRACFQNLAQTALDVAWFSRRTRERVQRYVKWDASFVEALRHVPAVFVTGHFGNWELMGQSTALGARSATSPAKSLGNRAIGRMLHRFRSTLGMNVVPVDGALRPLLRELKNGGIALLVMDQDTRTEDGGVFVDFFGLPVPITKAAAALGMKQGCPVVPVFCRRLDGGDYVVYARPPVTAPPGADEEGYTALIARSIEAEIRRYPESWVWVYKRWKRVVSWGDRARYPFYADVNDVRL